MGKGTKTTEIVECGKDGTNKRHSWIADSFFFVDTMEDENGGSEAGLVGSAVVPNSAVVVFFST